jgi:hypothetical protein
MVWLGSNIARRRCKCNHVIYHRFNTNGLTHLVIMVTGYQRQHLVTTA